MIEVQLQKRLNGAQGAFTLNISMQIAQGEMVALYGASGAGKTTVLRCLAGLEQAEQGWIRVQDQYWYHASQRVNLSPQQRQVGLMSQDFALFPNMSVRGNIAFALPKGRKASRVNTLLEIMGLQALQHHMPATLSGGQKQRVALARTLASEPSLLLLDEPLSALDATMRTYLQDELLQLQKSTGLTTVMVSHEVGEVYKLAQRVLVMRDGKIVESGTPIEVFARGETSGKFRFYGEVLAMEPVEVLVSLTVLVSNQIVRVVAMPDEAASLKVGDRVMLVSKAFNPMVIPLDRP